MRAYWLGIAAWVLAAGCAHQNESRPLSDAPSLAEAGSSAVELQGVKLVVEGWSWEGQPRDIERFFHPVEIRLENHSGRPLSLRYEYFEFVGEQRTAALAPGDLSRVASAQSPRPYRNPDLYTVRRSRRQAMLFTPPMNMEVKHDSSHIPYTRSGLDAVARCTTCPREGYAARIPSQDMLRQAFREGPLEEGRTREGFLYFDQLLMEERPVAFQVRLVDAHTGEDFGTLSVPLDAD